MRLLPIFLILAGSAYAEGSWQRLAPPREVADHASVVDEARDRMLVFDQDLGHVWSLDLAPGGGWTRIDVVPPTVREQDRPAILLDKKHDRVLLFGGREDAGTLWQLPLDGSWTWRRIDATDRNSPGPQTGARLVYDPNEDRAFLVGIVSKPLQGNVGDIGVWEHPLLEGYPWLFVPTNGTLPPPTNRGFATFDVRRNRVVFVDPTEIGYGTYEPAIWTLTFNGGSTPRWKKETTTGNTEFTRAFAGAYDEANDRIWIQGGYNGSFLEGGYSSKETYRLSLSTLRWEGWVGQSYRIAPSLAVDAKRQRLILHGGYTNAGETPLELSDETWVVPLDQRVEWERIGGAQGPPPTRIATALTYDPLRDRMLLFGGTNGSDLLQFRTDYNDLWTLDLAGRGEWHRLAESTWPDSPEPFVESNPGRTWSFNGYDPATNRWIAFGGVTWPGFFSHASISDGLYEMDPGAASWAPLKAQGPAPEARWGQAAVIDRVRHRFVVFGGQKFGQAFDDVWSLDLGGNAWTRLAPSGEAPQLGERTRATYDARRDRAVVFVPSGDGTGPAGVFTYDLAHERWDPVAVSGGPIDWTLTTAHDPVRDRELVFEPEGAGTAVWALEWSPAPHWVPLAPDAMEDPIRLSRGAAAYDPVRDRFVLLGTDLGNPTWSLAFGTPQWDPQLALLSPNGVAADHGRRANDLRVALLSRAPLVSAFAPRSFALDHVQPASLTVNGVAGSVALDRKPAGDLDHDGVADLALSIDRDAVRAGGGTIVLAGTTSDGATVEATLASPVERPSGITLASVPDPFRVRADAAGGLMLDGVVALPTTIALYDVRGRRVGSPRTLDPGPAPERLEWAGLSRGVYFARITDAAATKTVRMVRL